MKINNINNKKVLIGALIKYLMSIIITVSLISIVALVAGKGHISVVDLVTKYNLIIFLGICGSMILHEMSHYIAMRWCQINNIGLETTWFRFSIFTSEQIYGKKLLMIAIAGVFSTTIVGSILFGINLFLNNYVIKVIMWIYYIHLINILPLFGDGKMLLKALITMKVKDV